MLLAMLVFLVGGAKPPEDVSFAVTPRMSFASPDGSGSIITARIRVLSDAEKFYCPEFRLVWGDGGIESTWQDRNCEPYEKRDEDWQRTFSRAMPLTPGQWNVYGQLWQGRHRVWQGNVVVQVR